MCTCSKPASHKCRQVRASQAHLTLSGGQAWPVQKVACRQQPVVCPLQLKLLGEAGGQSPGRVHCWDGQVGPGGFRPEQAVSSQQHQGTPKTRHLHSEVSLQDHAKPGNNLQVPQVSPCIDIRCSIEDICRFLSSGAQPLYVQPFCKIVSRVGGGNCITVSAVGDTKLLLDIALRAAAGSSCTASIGVRLVKDFA